MADLTAKQLFGLVEGCTGLLELTKLTYVTDCWWHPRLDKLIAIEPEIAISIIGWAALLWLIDNGDTLLLHSGAGFKDVLEIYKAVRTDQDTH